MHLLAKFGSFCKPKGQISLPLHRLQLLKSLTFHNLFLKPEKGTFSGGAIPYSLPQEESPRPPHPPPLIGEKFDFIFIQ